MESKNIEWEGNNLNVNGKTIAKVIENANDPLQFELQIQNENCKLQDVSPEIAQKFEQVKDKFAQALKNEGLELEIAYIELQTEKLKNDMKKHRKTTTTRVLTNIAIFTIVFMCLRNYGENTFLLSILQSFAILLLYGFIVMVFKYMKWRKDENKYS